MIIKAMNARLQSSEELAAIVEDKIYPIDVEEDIKAPAITFNAGDTPTNTRSGNAGDDNEALILIMSRTYSELSDLIVIVRRLFNNTAWVLPEIRIISSTVQSVNRGKSSKYKEYQGIMRIKINSKLN